MNDDYWNDFAKTGKIEDYLKYKNVEQKAEVTNENYHQGFDNKGTINRGE